MWLAMPSGVSPVEDLVCPPLSVRALYQESAASVPAHGLLRKRDSQADRQRGERSVT